MDAAQNLWIRLTSKQFSRLEEGESYPGMVSFRPSMRFRKFLNTDRSAHGTEKWTKFSEKWRLGSLNQISAALPGAKPWKGLSPYARKVLHDS